MRKIIAVIAVAALGVGGWFIYRARNKPSPVAQLEGSGSAGSGSATSAPVAIVDTPTSRAVAELTKANAALLAASPDAATARTRIAALIDATVALATKAAADRPWDPATILAKVGKDRAALFAWVRDQTALVPYRGTLRDAVGVMMDRVGNSLDRSLLLADLLKGAGFETRLAMATLEPDAAAKLAASWSTRARPALSTAVVDDSPEIAALAASLGGGDLTAKIAAARAARQRLDTTVRAQIGTQATALAALVPAGAAPALDPMVFADHWWVQVRDGDAWIDLDATQSAPGVTLVPAAETFARDAVPEDRRHTLTIRVIGEVWHDAAREEPVLLEHTFSPSSFYGQRIAFTNVPVDMPTHDKLAAEKDPAVAMRKALAAQTEWIPIVTIGKSPVVRYSVTDRGELHDLMDPNGNTNRLARVVQQATKNGVGAATGMLDELPGGTDDVPAAKPATGPHSGFTAEWIEFELRGPGLEPRVVRRTVFDAFQGPADRTALQPAALADAALVDRGLALVGEAEVLPMFAQLPAAFVADRTAKALLSAKPLLVEFANGKLTLEAMQTKFAPLTPIPGVLEALALLRFSWSPSPTRIYLDQLDLLTTRRRLVVTSSGELRRRDAIDIVHNAVAVWPDGKTDTRTVRVAQGVTDTIAESLIAACPSPGCTRGPNTSDVFTATGMTGWSLVTEDGSPALAALPATLRTLAQKDLAAGYVVVMPPASAKGSHASTWWRVRSESGEVLGQGLLGGTATVEYLTGPGQLLLAGGQAYYCHAAHAGAGCYAGAAIGAFGGLFGLISEPATMALGYLFTAMGIFVTGESSLPHED